MDIVEQLVEIRKSPRKMQIKYLQSCGIYDYIMSETEGLDKFNVRDRIDYIVQGKPQNKCYCGNLLKIWQHFCSPKCVANAPEFVARISQIQKDNAKERAEKTKQTMLRKYGVTHNNHVPEVRVKRKIALDKHYEKTKQETFSKLGLSLDLHRNKEYLQGLVDSCVSLNQLSEKLNGLSLMVLHRLMIEVGITCYPKSSSGPEREIAQFIESLGVEFSVGDRTLIKPYELDIVIPSKNIAIELDGIYFHSDQKTDKQYHLMKTKLCEDREYQLIHIYENEWIFKKELCKSILKSKLGLYDTRLFARKGVVSLISKKEGKQFFEENHLQSDSAASVYVGIKFGDVLISCMSFGKPRFSKECDWELIRFASKQNTQCVGSFDRLLKYFRELNSGTIMTYCDRRYSTGKTYSKFGTLIRTTEPGYSWNSLKDLHQLSRYQTQKSKLVKLFPTKYHPDKTEQEIMESAGYYKLYDSGNLVYHL